MIKEFSKINIEYENETISFIPENYYYIGEHNIKHVVMYKLKLVNKDTSVPIIESESYSFIPKAYRYSWRYSVS